MPAPKELKTVAIGGDGLSTMLQGLSKLLDGVRANHSDG
jgi:hypothetical protein